MIVWVLRTNKIPFLQSRPSTGLMLTTLLVMAAAIALPYSPLRPMARPGAAAPDLLGLDGGILRPVCGFGALRQGLV